MVENSRILKSTSVPSDVSSFSAGITANQKQKKDTLFRFFSAIGEVKEKYYLGTESFIVEEPSDCLLGYSSLPTYRFICGNSRLPTRSTPASRLPKSEHEFRPVSFGLVSPTKHGETAFPLPTARIISPLLSNKGYHLLRMLKQGKEEENSPCSNCPRNTISSISSHSSSLDHDTTNYSKIASRRTSHFPVLDRSQNNGCQSLQFSSLALVSSVCNHSLPSPSDKGTSLLFQRFPSLRRHLSQSTLSINSRGHTSYCVINKPSLHDNSTISEQQPCDYSKPNTPFPVEYSGHGSLTGPTLRSVVEKIQPPTYRTLNSSTSSFECMGQSEILPTAEQEWSLRFKQPLASPVSIESSSFSIVCSTCASSAKVMAASRNSPFEPIDRFHSANSSSLRCSCRQFVNPLWKCSPDPTDVPLPSWTRNLALAAETSPLCQLL